MKAASKEESACFIGCAYPFAPLQLPALHVPAAAQDVAGPYKGRTITLLMGTGPGGSYDLYGRTIADHMSRHIPGNPTIIVEHMPGAGGVVAGNHIYGAGPQDGSKILLSHALPLVEKLEPKGVQFESAKFNWLGTYDSIAQVSGVLAHRLRCEASRISKTRTSSSALSTRRISPINGRC